jgi:hypothetical protein
VFYELAEAQYIHKTTVPKSREGVANIIRSFVQVCGDLLVTERTVLL